MAKKLEEMKVRLAELNDERATLDAAIEEMIASMAQVAPEERGRGEWSRDGTSTQKYLELTERQADVEAEITELTRAIAAAGDAPSSSVH